MARIDKNHLKAKVTTEGGSAQTSEPDGERDPVETEVKPNGHRANKMISPNGMPVVMLGGGWELPLEEFGERLKIARSAAWVAGQFRELESVPPLGGERALAQQVQELTAANERLSASQAQLAERIAALELEIARCMTRLDEQVKELAASRQAPAPKSR